jgi:isoquinoline 1-oxidoreductase alpha subunit
MAFQLKVNGQAHAVDADNDTPLLWVLRENLGLTGTKFGCGIAQCGACTVFLDGKPLRSCSLPVAAVGGAEITILDGRVRRCSAPGSRATCRSAATANRGR